MEIRGNIGDKVLVPAKIIGIKIDESGTTYFLASGIAFKMDHFMASLDDMTFVEEYIPEEAPADEKKIKKMIDEAMDGPKDIQEKPKKKRGRPRKATIESIMEKAEKKKGEAKR
jgi:hypothetical protein